MSGTLQVGGITLGTHNSGTGKVDITNAGNLKVEKIQDSSGSNTLVEQSGDNWAWGSGVPSGSIVQVQSTQLSTSAITTGISAATDIVVINGTASSTGTSILDVNITPKITGSKIWLQCNWMGEWSQPANVYNNMFFFWRDTTKLGNTEANPGNRTTGISPATLTYEGSANADTTPEHLFMQYFDTHGINAGTQITYKLGVRCENASDLYTNRTLGDSTNATNRERGVSSLVAIELAP